MTKLHRLIAEATSAAGGEIIGRVRLQKIFYLLEQLGLNSGVAFSYHHYGPFSRELDEGLDAAKAFYGIREEIRFRVTDGAPFSVFILAPDGMTRPNGGLGNLSTEQARDFLASMKSVSSTVIELAATIYWLQHEEGFLDWRPELQRRKGMKAASGRTEAALALLQSLGLDHPQVTSKH